VWTNEAAGSFSQEEERLPWAEGMVQGLRIAARKGTPRENESSYKHGREAVFWTMRTSKAVGRFL
jgi:hypothetical protein